MNKFWCNFIVQSFEQDDPEVCLERVVPKGLLIPGEEPSGDASLDKTGPLPVIGTATPLLNWPQDQEKDSKDLENVPILERMKALNISYVIKREEKKKK